MSCTPMSYTADAWVPLMREALFNQLKFNRRYACPEANCSIIYGPKPACFENGMTSATEWQADASLWKEDTFFDAGTFCLPSVFPETSLEAYKVEYDLETGIHYVFLIVKGILGLSTSSMSSQSSHVAEFSKGVMNAVPRRGKSGASRHENSNGDTNSHRHPSPNIKAAIDLQDLDSAILSVRSSADIESDGYTGSEATTEIIEERMATTDSFGTAYSPEKCPREADLLYILTDLVVEDGMSPSPGSASASPSGDAANTPSNPSTNATSPTFSLPLDVVEDYAPAEKVSNTVSALDLDEKASFLKPWHWISLQWLDLAISDEQDYINYTCEKPQGKKGPGYAPKDENVDMYSRTSSPEEAEELDELEEIGIGEPEYIEGGQTVEVSPRISSPEGVESPLRLQYLDIDATREQDATDLDDEGLPEEAVVADDDGDDEASAEDITAPVGNPNAFNPNDPQIHHYNLLRYPVYQASRTPSALSLWVAMSSIKRVQIEDPVSLKAVISSQAARWVDPVLLEEDVSVQEEVRQDGSATAYRNSLVGLTKIQYEPYGTWQSDGYDGEEEIPEVVEADNKRLLDEAYETYGYAGLQQPYFVNDMDTYNSSHSFPCHSMKQERGWESAERRGNSNLRYVMDEDGNTRCQVPEASSTPDEAAKPTDLQEEVGEGSTTRGQIPEASSTPNEAAKPTDLREEVGEGSPTRGQIPKASSTPAEPTDLQEEEDKYAEDHEAAEAMNLQEEEDEHVQNSSASSAEDSEVEDRPRDYEADGHFQEASSLRSLLASSLRSRGALSPLKEGRFFTPGIREEDEELDDWSESLDGNAWETDENGVWVSPKKGKETLRNEMSREFPGGATRADEDAQGVSEISFCELTHPEDQGDEAPASTICHHTDGATELDNTLPTPVEESTIGEDVLRAELSIPYHIYNDLSEIPYSSDLAATVGQTARTAARLLIENLLW